MRISKLFLVACAVTAVFVPQMVCTAASEPAAPPKPAGDTEKGATVLMGQAKVEPEAEKTADSTSTISSNEAGVKAAAASNSAAKPKPAPKARTPKPTAAGKTNATTTVQPSKAVKAFPPLPTPPSPLSAEKQKRLADILEQYKADKLTPEEYHKERAKILAEP